MNGCWLVFGWKNGHEPMRLPFASYRKAARACAWLSKRGWNWSVKAVES